MPITWCRPEPPHSRVRACAPRPSPLLLTRATDVEALAPDHDDLLAREQLLGHYGRKATEHVRARIDDDDLLEHHYKDCEYVRGAAGAEMGREGVGGRGVSERLWRTTDVETGCDGRSRTRRVAWAPCRGRWGGAGHV